MQAATHRVGQVGRTVWFVAFEERTIVADGLAFGNRAANQRLDFLAVMGQRDVNLAGSNQHIGCLGDMGDAGNRSEQITAGAAFAMLDYAIGLDQFSETALKGPAVEVQALSLAGLFKLSDAKP